MKKNKEIKDLIDQYFKNISSEELYNKAIDYGFKDEEE